MSKLEEMNLEAMKIYQSKHGGTLAEASILFVNVVAALKEAAQKSAQSDVCPADSGKHSWHPNKDNHLIYSCRKCGTRG